ncbi:hypothetical protein M513_07964 [Trichuris suis]|uniref:Reverse transcriptase domain-containing protein n=1 Tax=Trichuris suis TaxID=68888 RepID=A0A085M1V4_9BILA|nr:hypothetical protein M513_07964 [Trichuris suis]
MRMLNESSNDVYAQNFVNSLQQAKPAKVRIVVQIQGQPCAMEADSGSDFSVISSKTLPEEFHKAQGLLQSGSCVQALQEETAFSHHGSDREILLGLEWFSPLGLSIQGVHQTHSEDGIRTLLEEFADVFNENLGTYKGPKVTLPIDPKVPPIRLKARNVPLAIRPRVEAEIKRLLKEKVLEPISNPKWSTPVVPVIKPTGATRLCDDYKITINTALQDPSISSTIRGGYYSKIDMAQAYLELPVDDASAEAQTVITHMGAFKVKRLQVGVCIAPGVFQQVMDDLLRDIPGTTPYFDDILIRGTMLPELTDRLR